MTVGKFHYSSTVLTHS